MGGRRGRSPDASGRGAVFLTGATGFLGSRLLAELARSHRPILALVRAGSERRFERARAAALDQTPDAPIELVHGDLTQPHLGLDAGERDRVLREVNEVFHLAALTDLSAGREQLMATNVEGTDRLLELAREIPRLRRLHFASSFEVSGDYPHAFPEDQLFVSQRFASDRALSKFRAEAAVRKNARLLPITIYRLGALVGDSRTGEMPRLDGPYLLFEILRRLRKVPSLWPLIGPGADHFVQMIPVDYAVAAITAIAARERRRGGTFTLTDPRPPTYFEFFGLVCDRLGLRRPRVGLPLRPLRRALALPLVSGVLRRSVRAAGFPDELLPYLHASGLHDTSNTEGLLGSSGPVCPRVSDYLDVIFDYYLAHLAPGAAARPSMDNPGAFG